MRPIVLFRPDRDTEDEMGVAGNFFPVTASRMRVPPESLVVARYSALPYYQELETDLAMSGSRLLNTYKQHRWIANFDYYEQLKDFTFRTWDESAFAHSDFAGPVVVKGRTNSRKHHWNKTMFARDRDAAWNIFRLLSQDSMIGEQGIIFREYVPLKTLEIGLDGLPFSNEFRFFFYKESLLCHGFYWNNMCDCPEKANLTDEGIAFARAVAAVTAKYADFFVLDIAEKTEGGWVLVEVNDGQQSGLSACDPERLYDNLARTLVVASEPRG